MAKPLFRYTLMSSELFDGITLWLRVAEIDINLPLGLFLRIFLSHLGAQVIASPLTDDYGKRFVDFKFSTNSVAGIAVRGILDTELPGICMQNEHISGLKINYKAIFITKILACLLVRTHLNRRSISDISNFTPFQLYNLCIQDLIKCVLENIIFQRNSPLMLRLYNHGNGNNYPLSRAE